MSTTRSMGGYPPPRLPRAAWALLWLDAVLGILHLVVR